MMKGWNTMSEKGTSLAQYVEHFGLEILNHGDTYETDKVESTNVNRPDLQILGLFDYFDARRIQVMGKAELTYIMKMSENRRTKVFDDLFSYTIPALVLARNMECPAECLQCARNHGRTLLRTTERTADFTSHTMEYLSKQLAPCITRHGVLLDIYGEGVMITGDSGVGKSESAIELIMRGHRLVADDAVEIRLVADQLIGTAPEVIRNYIEAPLVWSPVNDEDTATYGQYYTDVNKYWWEEITKFVAGTESLDNWDSYVQHCKDMGQDKLLEVFLNSQK